MLSSWWQWCRLCAKTEGNQVDIFVNNAELPNLSEKIEKLFQLKINPAEDGPTSICSACYNVINGIVKLRERVKKSQKLFTAIALDKVKMIESDLELLRKYYTNGAPVLQLADKSTDTLDLLMNFIQVDDNREIQNSSVYTVLVHKSSKSLEESQSDSDASNLEDIHQNIKAEEDDSNERIEVLAVQSSPIENNLSDNDNMDYNDNDNLVIKAEEVSIQEVTKPKINIRNGEKRLKVHYQQNKCEACDKQFTRASTYRQHMKACPQKRKPTLFPCSNCEKSFPTEKRAQQHAATHLPPELKMIYPCDFCNKKFTKAINVTAHVKAIHIGEKPFICEKCGKTFSTKGALKEHKYTHIDETPFQCSKCPKKFKNLPRLKTHEDTHNDTIYVCPHCGVQLNTKRTLQMHMVVHSDQKKYKCNHCGNEYKRSKALKNHLILHTGLRPYTCPFCDKTFANGSNCRSHKKKAHPLELAAMEASGEKGPVTNMPRLEHLKAVGFSTPPQSSSNQTDDKTSSPENSPSLNGIQRQSGVSYQLHSLHQLQQENQDPFQHSIFDQFDVSLDT